MYHNSLPSNGSAQGYSSYPDNQYGQGASGTDVRRNNDTVALASHQSQNYYGYASMPQQFSSRYPMTPSSSQTPNLYAAAHNPLAIAHQTDQTLTAIACARRLPRGYIKDSSNVSPPTRGPHHEAHSLRDPSDMRSAHVKTNPSSTSTGNPKSAEGRACSCCGKTFVRPSALKIHMATHTGEKAYICPETGCHRSFSVRSNMSRHVRNVHKIWPDGHEEASDSGDEVEQP